MVAFGQYVKTHEADIDAIGVLLSRPSEWNPEVLSSLRETLNAAPQRFTIENLQRAHQVRYRKALVDIISMIKHASDEQNPLLSAAERADLAFQKVTGGRSFTPEQQQWLERIRTHLQENLSVDQEDFDIQPLFARFGGFSRVSAVFADQLPTLIKEFNQAIAA